MKVFKFLKRIWRTLFPAPLLPMMDEASKLGRVSMSEVDIGQGAIGWYVSIRPPKVKNGPHSHRYSWTGQDPLLSNAIEQAVEEAREFPVMVDMTKAKCSPRLGGKEFDE